MTKRPKIRAAGAVVMREHDGNTQVLLVYREAYRDWSLPKGKGRADELAPETAVREVWEETGVRVRLGLRLPTIKYQVPKGLKAVKYWRAEVLSQTPRQPDDEIAKVRWFDAPKALRKLTYPAERQVVETALACPPTTPFLLVRHAKAMLRKDWSGADQERRLAGRGRRQARRLRLLLGAFGVEALYSSPSTRCVETLRPYAEDEGVGIITAEVLTEEEGTPHPKHVRRYVRDLYDGVEVPTALCGHRPVLPAIFEGVGIKQRAMLVAEVVVLHRDGDGETVTVEVHKPTA